MKTVVKSIVVLLILGGLGAGGWWYFQRNASAAVAYSTAEVKSGEITATIGATGTVEPEEVVDVGAQVAGQILTFGKDKNGKSIDYGSEVEAGTILAQIDDTLYAADAAVAQSQLEQNKAAVVRAQADLGQMTAKYDQAKADWDRAQKIGMGDALAETIYDGYRAAFEQAKANVAVGQASIVQAQAAISQTDAQVKRTKRNLSYCTIASPVKGVIIDRRVNIGQTVVASLNAPSLFLIAKDLKRMQVWVAVNEADIGSIKAGQPVKFQVDAFPGEAFVGEVGKVRLNAAMTQNVVTFTVEVLTDNSSARLMPYLTANVQFEVAYKDDVLLVPNAALRFTPQAKQIAAEPVAAADGASAPKTGRRSTTRAADGSGRGTIWVQEGQFVRAVQVRTGLTDGTMTEVRSDKLPEGTQVIVAEVRTGSAPTGDVTNPFTPQLPRGGGRGR